MGLSRYSAWMLYQAYRCNASFNEVLTIGRQTNYLTIKDLEFVMSEEENNIDLDEIAKAQYAEPFFYSALKSRKVDSIDYCDYEGAVITHDMNKNIPSEFKSKYDVVVETGTLEHIFNFPIAVHNCMQLLKKGGLIFFALPANNYCGHGFYQFSPELFYRIFSERNGFTLEKMIVVESWFSGIERGAREPVYLVNDPSEIGRRITLINNYPALIMLQGRKIGKVPSELLVMQSDYVSTWEMASDGSLDARTITENEKRMSRFKNVVKKLLTFLPKKIEYYLRSLYERKRFHSVRDRVAYTPIKF
ncbi:MAG: hypothetical protein EOM12_09400 [Verrucomicrobiae bacterium]|nr:hypothetical protein [Verrucomicrobiae bacterium]